MGGSSGGSKTTKTEPWKGQQPYLKDLMSQAQQQYYGGVGQQYYPGQTVAGFSDPTQMAINQMTQQGMYGSPMRQPMNQFLGQSMMNPAGMAGVGMGMPGQNPYLDQMVGTVGQRMGEQFGQQIMPQLNATFGGAGRTGGGIHQQVAQNAAQDAMRAFGQQAADIYGADYSQAMDRDIQRRQLAGDIGFRGASLAPQAQAMQFADTAQLAKAGGAIEDQAQRLIDADRARFDFYQQAPIQALQQYGNIVQGMPGGLGTTTQSGGGGSRLMGGLGGAATGAGIGSALALSNPMTAGLAVGGGLLGLL